MDALKDLATRLGFGLGIAFAFASIGCGDLVGLGGDAPPLATVQVRAVGDVAVEGELRVALVWGEQWLPEAMCILTAESAEVEAVVADGCRNSLAFTPARVGTSVPIVTNTDTLLELYELPAADVMIGGLDARIAYASLVVFDDVDRSGALELSSPRQLPQASMGPGDGDEQMVSSDILYGASFVAMTEPDRRLAFREGDYALSAFYPRRSCGDPLPAFSVVSAGGFTLEAALAATAANELPEQDPASCDEAALDATVVEIPVREPEEINEVGCHQYRTDSSVRYRQPAAEALDLTDYAYACTGIPSFSGETEIDLVQLVIASRPDATCRGLNHYTLRGCDEGELECDHPEWDFVDNPPAWWPCPAELP